MALTRAYEDVRYGGLRLDGEALAELDRRARRVLDAVRRNDPVPPDAREIAPDDDEFDSPR